MRAPRQVAAVAITPDGTRALAAKFPEHKGALLAIDGQTVTRDLVFEEEVAGGIAGVVLGFDGNPVPRATVHLSVPALGDQRWFHETFTDAAGELVIRDLAPGPYRVHAFKDEVGGVAPAEIRHGLRLGTLQNRIVPVLTGFPVSTTLLFAGIGTLLGPGRAVLASNAGATRLRAAAPPPGDALVCTLRRSGLACTVRRSGDDLVLDDSLHHAFSATA